MSLWDSVAANNNSIAAALHTSLGSHHRYIGKGKWEYRQDGSGPGDVWLADENNKNLKKAMIAESSKVMDRALHWSQYHDDLDSYLKCDILARIAAKLKGAETANAIIREAREFFVDQ
jgi:hypothetical protein